MPDAGRFEKLCGTASLLVLTVWIVSSAAKCIYHFLFDNFNVKWGLNTFFVAHICTYEILMKAYSAWMETSDSRVVQNHCVESAGHILNYVIHSLAFFVYGGFNNRQVELDYMNLGFDDTSGWLSTLHAANCRVGYWTKLLFPTFIIALWSNEVGDSPWLSRKCILFMDRLMTRVGDGPTKAQLAA